MNKDIEKLIKSQDWKGMAKAYQDMQGEWHAAEWKEFVEAIRAEQKAEDIEIVRGIKNASNEHASNDWFGALHCVIDSLSKLTNTGKE